MTRYKGNVAAWDVVNEAFEPKSGKYGKTFWFKTLGKDYIQNSFLYAHEADPNVELFYNDLFIPGDTTKLNRVLVMIQEFKEMNIPITGIGLQMHIHINSPDKMIAYIIRKTAATGLKIHISELDIAFNMRYNSSSQSTGKQFITKLTDELRQAQAIKYKNVVKMYRTLVPPDQQYGITLWDFNDRDTWIRSFFKIKDWPTVFDESLDPKPAFYGFAEGLVEEL